MTAKPLLPVINKSDLPQRLEEESLKGLLREGTPPAIRISAKYGDGIDRLTAALRDLVLATPAEESSEVMIAHLHHKTALEKAASGLVRARDGLTGGLPRGVRRPGGPRGPGRARGDHRPDNAGGGPRPDLRKLLHREVESPPYETQGPA